MALYHRDIYMPEAVVNREWNFSPEDIEISNHALLQATKKWIDLSDIYLQLSVVLGVEVVEAEFVDRCLTKIVIRRSYSQEYDICYVLRYDLHRRRLILITVWLNSVEDSHSTLDESVYEKE